MLNRQLTRTEVLLKKARYSSSKDHAALRPFPTCTWLRAGGNKGGVKRVHRSYTPAPILSPSHVRHQCVGDLRGQNILKNMGYVWGTVNPNSHVLMFFCSVFKSRAQKAFALGTRQISLHFSLSERARKFTKSGCPPFSSRRLCAELRVPKELILRPENSPKKSTRRRRVRMF